MRQDDATTRGRWFVRCLVLGALAAAGAAAPSAAAPPPEGLPQSLSGSVSWEYAKAEDGQFGYKHYDFGETFSWSGTLVNQTPGIDTFARYESSGGAFGFDATWTTVTTPGQNCDVTTTNTYTHGGSSAPSFDKVTLSVYADDNPRAVIAAQCGATNHQVTLDCMGGGGTLDTDTARTIAHGDSGATGVLTKLPGGKLRVSFDVTVGSKLVRPFEYERISATFEIPVPCKLDLAAKGVKDAEEESVGALVVKRTEESQAPRLPVVARRVKGLASDVVLRRQSSRIKAFTASKGGSEIAFDGSSNRFPPSSLPKTFFVEGAEQSEEMRDAALTLEVADDPECKDTVKFTVLWVDPPEFKLSSSESFSPDDDAPAIPRLIAAAGGNHLGLSDLTAQPIAGTSRMSSAARAWLAESRARVHPHAFSYPGVKVAIAHFIEYGVWSRAPGASRDKRLSDAKLVDVRTDSGDNIATDTARDDDPDPDDRIYHVKGPGLPASGLPAGTIQRLRANYNAAAYILKGRRTAQQCSEIRSFWIRFSAIYQGTGKATTAATLSDIASDNDAQEGGAQPLTADLK